MYTIRLMNCAFFARHGALEEEARLGQRFYVDAVLSVEAPAALEGDDLAATVHYGEAFALIEEIVTGTRRNLIEALANDVAKALCERFSVIVRAEITVRKPAVPIAGVLDFAETTVAWPRD